MINGRDFADLFSSVNSTALFLGFGGEVSSKVTFTLADFSPKFLMNNVPFSDM